MDNQLKSGDKHLEILADLIPRLQGNKRSFIERIARNLAYQGRKKNEEQACC